MNRVFIALLALCLAGCASIPERSDSSSLAGLTQAQLADSSSYEGLTQAQLAKRLGFPMRIFLLPSDAHGGPGLLFWSYYQRSTPDIDEKVFVFAGSPLKVKEAPLDVNPSIFLSLERASDVGEIFKYEAKHGR